MAKIQPDIVDNRFTGVNQRVLRTESKDFSVFNGCFPSNVGIQSRIYGKSPLHKFTNPVQAIFQAWAPQGYAQGIFQTNNNVSIAPWLPPAYNFPLNSDGTINSPTDVNIGSNGSPSGDMSGTYDAGSGLGGLSRKYHLVFTDYVISDFLSNLKYFTGSTSHSTSDPDPPPAFGYLPFSNATAINQTTPPINELIASLDSITLNGVRNNLFPPPNNFLIGQYSSTAINTTGQLDLSSIISTPQIVLITILATVNGVDTEIPFNISFSDIQANPIIQINTNDYIVLNTIAQTAFNFNALGDPVSVPPDSGPGLYGMSDRNQEQNSAVIFNLIRVYTCQLTA